MIKALIIEDEQNTLEVLKKMLHLLHFEIEIVGETGYVQEAVTLIQQLQPQLVFMDIQLEDGTGFSILEKLKNIDFQLIFTTAYDQYAIKAFKFCAIDYLLKPIDPQELELALNRAITSINKQENYQELLNRINNKSEDNIVLKTTEQKHIVPVNSIIRLEADGAYTIFITISKQLIVSKNLKFYQDLLKKDFIRCHQSHLVHKKHIKGFNNDVLYLSNGDNIPISRRNKSDIKALLA